MDEKIGTVDPSPTDCPNLSAFVTSRDFVAGVNHKAYEIAQRFRPVEWRDLARAITAEIWKDANRHRYEGYWSVKGDEAARRIINHAVDADARRLAFETRAELLPLDEELLAGGLSTDKLAAALGWPIGQKDGRRRDHWTGKELWLYAAVGLIKSWSPQRQRLFQLAWIDRRPWAEIAAELGGNEDSVRRRGARIRQYARNARAPLPTMRPAQRHSRPRRVDY